MNRFHCPSDGPRIAIDHKTGEIFANCNACSRCAGCAPGHVFVPDVHFQGMRS